MKQIGILLLISIVVISGCKGKVEQPAEVTEEPSLEIVETPVAEVAGTAGETAPATTAETLEHPTAEAPAATGAETAATEAKAIGTPKEIQTALKNAGFYNGTVDGIVGPATKKAVKEFQQANGLTVDGVVGKQTWTKLKQHLK